MRTIIPGALLFGALGCAGPHPLMRGSVVMKLSDTEAHVCLGEDEVAVGDRVKLFHNDCTPEGRRTVCRRVELGEGRVTELLSSHYSVVNVPGDVNLREGDTVERVK